MDDAVERYCDASAANDIDAIMATLAPDAALASPLSGHMVFRGHNDLRVLLGGSWKSPSYLYFDPEALSPFDRSETNGFRCVRNLGLLPAAAQGQLTQADRDFSKFKPVCPRCGNSLPA